MSRTGMSATLSGATTGAIGGLKSISLSGWSVDSHEVKTLDSLIATKLKGHVTPGNISCTFDYDKDDFKTLFEAHSADAEVWTITLGDGTTCVVTGWIADPALDNPESPIEMSCTIECSNMPEVTPAT